MLAEAAAICDEHGLTGLGNGWGFSEPAN